MNIYLFFAYNSNSEVEIRKKGCVGKCRLKMCIFYEYSAYNNSSEVQNREFVGIGRNLSKIEDCRNLSKFDMGNVEICR